MQLGDFSPATPCSASNSILLGKPNNEGQLSIPVVTCNLPATEGRKVSPLVEFAVRARMDAANVSAIGLAVGRGFHLHPHEVPAGLDHHVVARRISPRLGEAQTVLGGSGHKLQL